MSKKYFKLQHTGFEMVSIKKNLMNNKSLEEGVASRNFFKNWLKLMCGVVKSKLGRKFHSIWFKKILVDFKICGFVKKLKIHN